MLRLAFLLIGGSTIVADVVEDAVITALIVAWPLGMWIVVVRRASR